MSTFDDIRPYVDSEVGTVLGRLLANESLFTFLADKFYGHKARWAPGVCRWFIKRSLKSQVKGIETVNEFQQQFLKPHVFKLVNKTISQVSVSGIEHLDPAQNYLFLSNHRDIAMDPLLVNYALTQHGLPTSKIAIGDNLLKQDFVADIMRLNKSFIVKRALTGKKEKFVAFSQLSDYIRHSLLNDSSIWLAHREGRAKDGDDLTHPAVIKMLYMSYKREKAQFTEALSKLKVVPVALSYEFDPCDTLKSKELSTLSLTGKYEKTNDEDFKNIITGLSGHKGRVHVAFGDVITPSENPDELVDHVNQQIWSCYCLYASHWFAAKQVKQLDMEYFNQRVETPDVFDQFLAANLSRQDELLMQSHFDRLCEHLSDGERLFLYKMYANPVYNKIKVGGVNS